MGEVTRITEKGQATIPKPLRERYNLEPGDEVVWFDTGDGIAVRKRTRTEARGMLLSDTANADQRAEVAEELRSRVADRRERNYDEV